jgi:PAS domain-containing protein
MEPMRTDSGELIGFARITRDITERRIAQEALRESERQFRLLVASVTDHAIYMLDPNGVVVSWNNGAQKIDAIRDDRGQLVGFAKITRDITEQREAQAASRKAHEQLAHAQKIDALISFRPKTRDTLSSH